MEIDKVYGNVEMVTYNWLFREDVHKLPAAEAMLGELPIGTPSTNHGAGPAASQVLG